MTQPVNERVPVAVWALLTAVVAWGLYPYRIVADHYAWKVDALKWVTEGATTNPDWPTWVFATTHFVGYRPVAAASFTVNHAIGGWTPEVYRATDFGLHALAAFAVALLFRRLAAGPQGDGWRGGLHALWLLVPVWVFVGHPGVEEALPYLARRSYLIATAFGTLGLVAWLDHLRQDRTVDRSAFAATALLTIAILSNEAAYVVLPMVPLLALHERWTGSASLWSILKRCLLPLAPALPAVLARFAVLGWTGGYHKHYFAYARDGKKVLREVYSFNGHEILGASFEYAWFPISFVGARTWVATSAIATFLVAAFYFWAIVVEPLLDPRDRLRRVPLVLGIWILGYGLLYGLSRTWFWRQGYPMLVPFALIIAWVAWDTARRFGSDPWRLAVRAVPQCLLFAALIQHSPLFVGMTVGPLLGRFEGNQILHHVEDALGDLEGPAAVYTVLPLNKQSTRNTHAWLDRLYRSRDVQFKGLASGVPAAGLASLQGDRLVLGTQAAVPDVIRRAHGVEDRVVRLPSLRAPARPSYVLFPEDGTTWKLIPVDP